MTAGTAGVPPVPDRALARKGGTVRSALWIVWSAARAQLIVLLLLTTVTGLFMPLSVWITEHVVNLAAAAAQGRAGASQWIPWSVALGLAFAAQRLLPAIDQNFQRTLGESVSLHVDRIFLAAVSRADQEVLESPQWRDRMTRAAHSIGPRATILAQGLLQFYGGAITAAGLIVILVTVDPLLLVFAAVLMVISFPQQRAQANALYKLYNSFTKNERERTYLRFLLSETMPSKELRAYGLRDYLLNRYADAGAQWIKAYSVVSKRMNHYSLYVGAATAAAAVASYIYVISQGMHGKISPGGIAAIIAAFIGLTSQLSALSGGVGEIQESVTFLDDFFSFLALEPTITAVAPVTSLPRQGLSVQFEKLYFSYPGTSRPAISDLNLTIESGELLALVGLNGSGKTTLTKLLLRLYDPDAGSIHISGVNLRNVSPAEIRERIGVLFQDYMNYDFTVRDNVTFGRIARQHSEEDLEEALANAQAQEIVNGLAHGPESHLGALYDDGHPLSGGELQRLALARLFFRNADIWILDEPTSSLDAEAEVAVFAQIKRLLSGRTGIITSHRFSTVRLADRIAVMADGAVTELGTHDELMLRGGKYAEMFESQAQQYR